MNFTSRALRLRTLIDRMEYKEMQSVTSLLNFLLYISPGLTEHSGGGSKIQLQQYVPQVSVWRFDFYSLGKRLEMFRLFVLRSSGGSGQNSFL